MKSASLTLHFRSIADMLNYISDHGMNPVKKSNEAYELQMSMAEAAGTTDGKPCSFPKHLCQECGKEFEPKQQKSRFCSKKCSNRNYMREYWKTHKKGDNGKVCLKRESQPNQDPDPEPDQIESDHKNRGVKSRPAKDSTFYNGQFTMP